MQASDGAVDVEVSGEGGRGRNGIVTELVMDRDAPVTRVTDASCP